MNDPRDAITDRLPTRIAPGNRLLTAAEFHRLADVPPEVEWFANLSNPSTRRAYHAARISCASPDPISPPWRVQGRRDADAGRCINRSRRRRWVSNNWQDPASCYDKAAEGVSTRCSGQGVVVFYGVAKPVRAPQIGLARGF